MCIARGNLEPLFSLIRLGRPLFLAGGVVFHALGLSIAFLLTHHVNGLGALFLQIAISFTQLMTHYANDYFDRDGDALNTMPTAWSGGSRVLLEGLLAPRTALIAAVTCAGIAIGGIVALMLVTRPGLWALAMLITALLAGWFYSAPPIRLVGRGLGEPTGALVVPGLTTALGYGVQVGRIDPIVVAVVLPFSLLQFAMLLAVAAPDLEADRASGKRTLVVELGRDGAGRLYAAMLIGAYAILAVESLTIVRLWPTPVYPALATLPIGGLLAWSAWRGGWRDPASWAGTAFWTIAILIGTAVIESIAWVWLALTSLPAI